MPSYDSIAYLAQGRQISGAFTFDAAQGVVFVGNRGKQITVEPASIAAFALHDSNRGFVMTIQQKDNTYLRFSGFPATAMTEVRDIIQALDKPVKDNVLDASGKSYGEVAINAGLLSLTLDDKLLFDVPLASVAQSVVHGKKELALEFVTDDQAAEEVEELTELRFFVQPHYDEEDRMIVPTPAEQLNEQLQSAGDVDSGETPLCTLEVPLLVPRGKYTFQCFYNHVRMSTATFSYKVPVANFTRIFLLDKPDEDAQIMIIGVEPPIRQVRMRISPQTQDFQRPCLIGRMKIFLINEYLHTNHAAC